MFTLEQIKTAHSKVLSGADFPKFILEIISIGVVSYDTFVIDGHSVYTGEDGYQIASEAKYPEIHISEPSHAQKFAHYLKTHQQGQTDYLVFCGHAAETGVEKWTVDTKKMTCSYYDSDANIMLTEQIPA